jgi:hypothetical protein
MALIAPQSVTVTGLAPVFSAPSASDTMAPADRRIYVVRTTGTATNVVITVTHSGALTGVTSCLLSL